MIGARRSGTGATPATRRCSQIARAIAIAPGGHIPTHAPQRVHADASTVTMRCSSVVNESARSGHPLTHLPHLVQSSVMTGYTEQSTHRPASRSISC
jgi:hypothetical protein